LQSIPQIPCTARLKYAVRTRMDLPADMSRYRMATTSITSLTVRLHYPHGDHCDDHGPAELV
jgi:hypothetical protein